MLLFLDQNGDYESENQVDCCLMSGEMHRSESARFVRILAEQEGLQRSGGHGTPFSDRLGHFRRHLGVSRDAESGQTVFYMDERHT